MQNEPIIDPRAAALLLLDCLNKSPAKTLDALLEERANDLNVLSRKDRGLFNQLLYGVLRWRLRLDTVVSVFSSRPLNKIDPTILNILRIALFQLLFLDRIPSSAAVNTAVELAKRQKQAKAAGFVNAILRNVLRNPGRFPVSDPRDTPVSRIAKTKSFPDWLVARWVKHIGADATEQRCDAMNEIPPITIRCNRLVNTLFDLQAALSDQVESFEILTAVPDAANLKRPSSAFSEMKAFNEGRFAIQDGAAQLITLLLNPRPGESVLDACAGMGGKTTHIAQLMDNRGTLVALDHSTVKLSLLEQEAKRLAVTILRTFPQTLKQPIPPEKLPQFDRILLDAPCSGLGVLRRIPDAKWSSNKRDVPHYANRQERFLHHLSPFVKKNGVLVYSVCSMEPEENEQVVHRFLKKHPNFAIKKDRHQEEKNLSPFLTREGFLRTDPHTHGLDGFFAARFCRVA